MGALKCFSIWRNEENSEPLSREMLFTGRPSSASMTALLDNSSASETGLPLIISVAIDEDAIAADMRPDRAFCLLLLAGCAARDQLPDYSRQADTDLPATYFEAVITARDGTRLSATVFQPALKAGTTAPLVVHSRKNSMQRASDSLKKKCSLVFNSGLAPERAEYGSISSVGA